MKKGIVKPASLKEMLEEGRLFAKEDMEDGLCAKKLDVEPKSRRGRCSCCGKRRRVLELKRSGSEKVDKFCLPCGDDLFNPGGEGL